jgi:hypothetical protein
MPLGYKTYYGGTFNNLMSQQVQVAAQEESTPEGTLVLLELNLAQPVSLETLQELNNRLISAGVPSWPGYNNVVFVDSNNPLKIYIAWVKGFAWTPVVIGILFLVLPIILGAVIWYLIPEDVRNAMMMIGIMAIMIPFMNIITKEK